MSVITNGWSAALVLAFVFGATLPAQAQEDGAAALPQAQEDGAAAPQPETDASTTELADAPVDSPWRGEFVSWIWLFGMTGDVGVGGVTSEVDANIIDIAEGTDSIFSFSGRLEIGYDRFAGFVDGTYAKVGIENARGPAGLTSIDITNEIGVVDFGLMYRITTWDGAVGSSGGSLDAYAGGRYMTLDVEFDPDNAPSRSDSRDWVDPIIGVKVRQPLTKNIHLDIWGDVGGFGVESDLTWSATGVIGMDFDLFNKLPATIYLGYRAIGWDYTEGSGNTRFEWDAVLHGPTLGLGIRF